MIIWISGPYGVGKTTLAEQMAAKMKNAWVFDAEAVGNAVRDNYPDHPYGLIFEDYPLWGDFCCQLMTDLHRRSHREILVPMTLLRRESYRMIEALRKTGIDTKLVILEASYQTVHDRILARGEAEDCWCMQQIELSRAGSSALPGIHVSTDDKTVEELCELVLGQVLSEEQKGGSCEPRQS